MKKRPVVPWRGFSHLLNDVGAGQLSEELNRFAENIQSMIPNNPLGRVSQLWGKEGFAPNVDVEDRPDEIIVRAELPGMRESDVEILLTKDALTLRGEKKLERQGDGYYEAEAGEFKRVIPVTEEIVEDQVDATMKDGVLTIRLKKVNKSPEGGKKIQIRTTPVGV